MLERDYTSELVVEAQKIGVKCERFGDTGRRAFNKVGYDNLLVWPDHKCAFVEMKIKKKKLTKNEICAANRNESNYFICRIFDEKIYIYNFANNEIVHSYLSFSCNLQDMVLKIRQILDEQ